MSPQVTRGIVDNAAETLDNEPLHNICWQLGPFRLHIMRFPMSGETGDTLCPLSNSLILIRQLGFARSVQIFDQYFTGHFSCKTL